MHSDHSRFQVQAICLHMFILPLFLLLALSVFRPGGVQAASATVGQDEGYSGKVLELVMRKWQLPEQVEGNQRLNAVISVNGEGEILNCRVTKASRSAALDASVCQAVRAAAPFGSPPYGMPAELYFTFFSADANNAGASASKAQESTAAKTAENAQASAASAQSSEPIRAQDKYDPKYAKYLSGVTTKLRNAMYVPVETAPGRYSATVQIKCDSSGKIVSSSFIKNSGDARLDKYIMQGIKRAGSIKAPPKGLGDTLDLTFSFVR